MSDLVTALRDNSGGLLSNDYEYQSARKELIKSLDEVTDSSPDVPTLTKEEETFLLGWVLTKEESVVLDKAIPLLSFNGFNPLNIRKEAWAAAKRFGGQEMLLLALTVALQHGKALSSQKVVSPQTLERISAVFSITTTSSITYPRLILSFPYQAFQIMQREDMEAKVLLRGWPKELSFSGSISMFRGSKMQDLLAEAYLAWSTHFGLVISQGRGRSQKNIVKLLSETQKGDRFQVRFGIETLNSCRLLSNTPLFPTRRGQVYWLRSSHQNLVMRTPSSCVRYPETDELTENQT